MSIQRRVVVLGLIYVGGGPLAFGILWFLSPPESPVAGAVRMASLPLGFFIGRLLATTITAKFAPNDRGRGFVLSVCSFFVIAIICIHASFLVNGLLGWAEFDRGLLFQMAIFVALTSGTLVGVTKQWESKTLREFYSFVSTSCIIAVLVFGTLRGLEEIVVIAATNSDKSIYVVLVPVLLIALFELTRREFNRPD